MNEAKFVEIVKKNTPKKKSIRNILLSFFGGGTIAIINEFIYRYCIDYLLLDEPTSKLIAVGVIILLATILTMFSIYNNIAQHLGAGIFLPTSGFANSLTSSAMEGRSEGLVPGIGATIFSLAGSVISFGIFVAFYFATIYYILNLLGINVWA